MLQVPGTGDMRAEHPEFEGVPDEITTTDSTVLPVYYVTNEAAAETLAESLHVELRDTSGKPVLSQSDGPPDATVPSSGLGGGDDSVVVTPLPGFPPPGVLHDLPDGEAGIADKGGVGSCSSEFAHCYRQGTKYYQRDLATCRSQYHERTAVADEYAVACCGVGAAGCASVGPVAGAACCFAGAMWCGYGSARSNDAAYANCAIAAAFDRGGHVEGCFVKLDECCAREGGCPWVR